MQQTLAQPRSVPAPRAKSASRDTRLLVTVVGSTLAAVAVFSLFYAIGAVIGLALIGAVGVAMIVGLAWLSLKASRRRIASRSASPAPRD